MNNLYATKDFYLSSYIVASGVGLKNIERKQGKTTFIFEMTPELNALIQEYYNISATVNPISYANAIKNLKSIIYAADSYTNTNYVEQSKGNNTYTR